MIPYGRQHVTETDIEAVVEVLRSDFLTQGPAVPRFEQAVAGSCGARHAVAVNSGTSALHLACRALGLGPGDTLWTSPITFVASANCALYCGAGVDFVDIDPRTGNLCPRKLEAKLRTAEDEGRLPKIVVPVHLNGLPCEMQEIRGLSGRYGFRIVEDAAHALGARYNGEPVGNCRHSDITIFSFHPVKLVTTGEGGAAVTNDAGLAERMALLRSHGITRDPARMDREPDGPWYYQQIELGHNYRMTDLQAALGVSQMSRLHEYISRRTRLAETYDKVLADLPLTLPGRHPDAKPAWHLYAIRIQHSNTNIHRRVFEKLREAGIGVNVHYIPVHLQPYYRALGFAEGDFPEAERYYASAITLPLYPQLTDKELNTVVDALMQSLS